MTLTGDDDDVSCLYSVETAVCPVLLQTDDVDWC